MTGRNAIANIDNVTHRYQDFQRRTWCSSSPAWPFAHWNDCSTFHRRPATLTKARNVTGVGL
ncbi:hypothetical protein ABIB25_004945 [Nakamurella sp. UYEF19]